MAGKQESQTSTKTKPLFSSKQANGQKLKHGKEKEQKPKSAKPSKIEPTPKNEAGSVSLTDPDKKEAGKAMQGGVLLDLLTDTTTEHGNHIYHPHCQVCLGKKPPPSTSTKEEELVNIFLTSIHTVFC